MRDRSQLSTRRRVPNLALAAVSVGSLALSAVAAGCIPKSVTDPVEVGGAQEIVSQPPVFPETGEVPPELLVEGLVYDFTTSESDLNLWSPGNAEANCAAEAIVAGYGGKLSDLGFEPGRSGAGLNDIALSADERTAISELFLSCIDPAQMLGAMLMGDGHMTAREASCMGEGLAKTTMPLAVVQSWMNGRGFDPIGEDSELAVLILDYTNVCLPDTSFTWNGVDLPGDEDLLGVEGSEEETSTSSPDEQGADATIPSGENPPGD